MSLRESSCVCVRKPGGPASQVSLRESSRVVASPRRESTSRVHVASRRESSGVLCESVVRVRERVCE